MEMVPWFKDAPKQPIVDRPVPSHQIEIIDRLD
jgi:hypothetical protein